MKKERMPISIITGDKKLTIKRVRAALAKLRTHTHQTEDIAITNSLENLILLTAQHPHRGIRKTFNADLLKMAQAFLAQRNHPKRIR